MNPSEPSSGHGGRKFYDLKQQNSAGRGTSRVFTCWDGDDGKADPEKLAVFVRGQVVGDNNTFLGPYGPRRILYCDHTASGRSLKFVESYILDEVLPHYGSTHTTTAVTSLQTTLFRHEARDIVRNACNASERDAVIFAGSGTTGAVRKLISCLGLDSRRREHRRIVVIVSLQDHHSNLLPWRSLPNATVVTVGESSAGQIDVEALERLLSDVEGDPMLIGCFPAASNITGTLNDDLTITALMHQHGGLAFWDYAAAAPYVHIDVNPRVEGDSEGFCRKDAVYFSFHKFVGGVQTPGVLIAKKNLFRNPVPEDGGGGGSVFFVTVKDQKYLKDPEVREEAGTPAIVESIRAGMVMQLKQAVGAEFILKREAELLARARKKLAGVQNLIVLGATLNGGRNHLPILSFIVKAPEPLTTYLHHNYVCSLLNDLFGIQARGGCACSGPYAQSLLGMSYELSKEYESMLLEDDRLDRVHLRRGQAEYSQYEILRPGFSRLNLPWFADDEEVDFVLDALVFIAEHGWKLMPQYVFNNETGEWHHHTNRVFKERKWLGHISYAKGAFEVRSKGGSSFDVERTSLEFVAQRAKELIGEAERAAVKQPVSDQRVLFHGRTSALRWMALPVECKELLLSKSAATKPSNDVPPFIPKRFEDPGKNAYVGSLHSKSNLHIHIKYLTAKRKRRDSLIAEARSLESTTCQAREPNNSARMAAMEQRICQSEACKRGGSSDETISFDSEETAGDGKRNAVCQNISGKTKSNDVGCSNEETANREATAETDQRPGQDGLEGKENVLKANRKWHPPTKDIFKPFLKAVDEFSMISDGDRVLVCLSGGKDSLTLLHTIKQYQFYSSKSGVRFDLGALTIDPLSSSYDPRPLIPYLTELGVPYLYERQAILKQAQDVDCSSICSFCSRMKRGRMYAAARREAYNVLALGQHLDDLAESFFMSVFHNGRMRTMKANYTVKEGDLRIIRPFVYVRENNLREFAESRKLPVIAENCPGCFESPKERHRVKQLLAQQELLFPKLYWSLKSAMHPAMNVRKTGVESAIFGKDGDIGSDDDES